MAGNSITGVTINPDGSVVKVTYKLTRQVYDDIQDRDDLFSIESVRGEDNPENRNELEVGVFRVNTIDGQAIRTSRPFEMGAFIVQSQRRKPPYDGGNGHQVYSYRVKLCNNQRLNPADYFA